MTSAPADSSAIRKKLQTKIASAQRQADAAKKSAKQAKSVFKLAKQKFKDAKRMAKKFRKELKSLKAELAVLSVKKKPARKAAVKRSRPVAPTSAVTPAPIPPVPADAVPLPEATPVQ